MSRVSCLKVHAYRLGHMCSLFIAEARDPQLVEPFRDVPVQHGSGASGEQARRANFLHLVYAERAQLEDKEPQLLREAVLRPRASR